MIKWLIPALLALLFTSSCKEQKSKPFTPATDTTHASFFPVTEYLRGQLRELDSLPVTPLKIRTANGHTDSAWIKKEEVRAFAEPFLHPDIDTANMKSLFAERSFFDQTVDAFTFSYEPLAELPDSLTLKRWDVYLDPKKNTVRRVYMVKASGDETLQLTWTSGKWCKITSITEAKGKPAEIKEEMVKWDFSE